MLGSVVHQCPKCELRFSFRTEMEHHLREDHPQQTPLQEPSAMNDEALSRNALPVAAPVRTTTPPEIARRRGGRQRARIVRFLRRLLRRPPPPRG